jgi:hypothetical protein
MVIAICHQRQRPSGRQSSRRWGRLLLDSARAYALVAPAAVPKGPPALGARSSDSRRSDRHCGRPAFPRGRCLDPEVGNSIAAAMPRAANGPSMLVQADVASHTLGLRDPVCNASATHDSSNRVCCRYQPCISPVFDILLCATVGWHLPPKLCTQRKNGDTRPAKRTSITADMTFPYTAPSPCFLPEFVQHAGLDCGAHLVVRILSFACRHAGRCHLRPAHWPLTLRGLDGSKHRFELTPQALFVTDRVCHVYFRFPVLPRGRLFLCRLTSRDSKVGPQSTGNRRCYG